MAKNQEKTNLPEFRAPVVTIMGHVDHGKTTLLDYIRKSHVADREFGGITQHVSAYQIEFENKPITFIDTPGHEAFFAMRERGSKITDIIILVVAADDGIMPQTKEVIQLWKKAKTQMIVAVNKIDMPGADVEKVKRQLASEGVLVEGYGGDIPIVQVSAKLGTNINSLLELINLVSEMNGLEKYTDISNTNMTSEAIVLESYLDKSIGAVATVIIKSGVVRRGEFGAGGKIYGKIRAIINDQGKTVDEAWESQPVKIVGIPAVFEVGEVVRTFKTENEAKESSKDSIKDVKEEKQLEFNKNILANIFANQEQDAEIKKLNVVIVADAKGSLEAILNSLSKIDVPGTKLNIIDSHTGNATLGDVNFASAQGGIVLVFNSKIEANAEKDAKAQGILVREYKIIYELIEEIEMALISLIEPTTEEEFIGEAEVRQVFQLSNGKFVAGCRVSKNKIVKGANVYFERRGERLHESKVSSLKHGKDEVKEATMGTECGILTEAFEPMTGDKVVCYRVKKVGF